MISAPSCRVWDREQQVFWFSKALESPLLPGPDQPPDAWDRNGEAQDCFGSYWKRRLLHLGRSRLLGPEVLECLRVASREQTHSMKPPVTNLWVARLRVRLKDSGDDEEGTTRFCVGEYICLSVYFGANLLPQLPRQGWLVPNLGLSFHPNPSFLALA